MMIQIDSTGDLDVRWPSSPQATIALGQKFVSRELTLAPEQRCPAPSLDKIRTAAGSADQAVRDAAQGEAGRATSSEAHRQAMDQATKLLKKAFDRLKIQYEDNLAVLEHWGLKTKVTRGKASVLKPTTPAEWEAFLPLYVAKETSLPEAERLEVPSLASLSELAAALSAKRASRSEGKTLRSASVQTRDQAVARLDDLLQTAACVLVQERYDGKVNRELELWGYTVAARPGGASPAEAAPGSATAPPA